MENKQHPKGIQKIIDLLSKNPKWYIIDYCEGNEFDLVKGEFDTLSVSTNQYWYLKDNLLIEWQEDTDQWGDRYRLNKND